MTKTNYTIGLDLGDKSHEICVINAAGTIAHRASILNKRKALTELSEAYPGSTVIMEAGTHSPWVSRHLKKHGLKVLVANPRKLRAIYESDNKSDERDAEMLARIGRFDPNMLYPISHNSEECQRSLAKIKCRHALVSSRTSLVNTTRGLLKSQGAGLPVGMHTDAFARKAREHLSPEDLKMVCHLLDTIESISKQIKVLEKEIHTMIAQEYPEAQRLQEIPGIGPITAIAFVLILEHHSRFTNARDVGPFLGLTPKRDQSGNLDKQLRITKAGNSLLRCLLVNCAQYTMGHFGPPSAIRSAGERIAHGGGSIAKKKAVVAVARRLAMLMLVLWKDPTIEYQPFPSAQLKKAA